MTSIQKPPAAHTPEQRHEDAARDRLIRFVYEHRPHECKPDCPNLQGEVDAYRVATQRALRAAVVGLLNGLEHHPNLTHGAGDCGICIWMARADELIDRIDGGAR